MLAAAMFGAVTVRRMACESRRNIGLMLLVTAAFDGGLLGLFGPVRLLTIAGRARVEGMWRMQRLHW
jgi:hypothetical protein